MKNLTLGTFVMPSHLILTMMQVCLLLLLFSLLPFTDAEVFPQIQGKNLYQEKHNDLLYCNTHFTVVVCN